MARSRLRPGRRGLFKKQRYHQGPTPLGEQSREQRRQDRSQKTTLKHRLAGFAALFILGALTYQFGFIRSADVIGLDSEASKEAVDIAHDFLHRGWYTAFKPLSDPDKLANSIELADSRFSGTQASWSWLDDTLTISSTLRQPVAVWQAKNDGNHYLLDSDGVVYIDSDQQSGNLPIVQDTTALKVDLSQQIISTTTLDFILLLNEKLDEYKVMPNSGRTYLLLDSPREVQLAIAGQPYKVRFITSRAASDQANELKEALDYLNKQKRTPSKYIDLRINDTAYYR